MELRHLRYFLALADTNSFTRAAAQSYVAQSALSQQIARLEAEVGTKLVFRTSRTVHLTEAGELLVPLARRILADVDIAQSEIDALTGLRRGRLRLGLIQTIACGFDVVGILGELHGKYPGIDLEIVNQHSTALLAATGTGALDIGIVGLDPKTVPASLKTVALSKAPMVAVVAATHRLAEKASTTVAELVEDGQFIHFMRGSGIRHQVDAAFERAGIPSAASVEVGQVEDMIRYAAHGLGTTIVPRAATEAMTNNEAQLPAFHILRLSDKSAVHYVTAVYDPRRLSSAARAFLEIMAEHRA